MYDERPLRSDSIRCWPVDSLALSAACALATVSGSSPSSSHWACCHASSEVSRERVWIRSPNRRVRPSASASSRIHVIFSRTSSSGSPHVR